MVSHPHLRAFTGELHEADKVALAMRAAKPDVVYVMLASETAPHTAVVSAHPGTGLWHPHGVLKIAAQASTPVRAAVPTTDLTLAKRSAPQSDRKPPVTLR